jgi:hypothetical protein
MVTISHVVQDVLKHHVLIQEAINHDIVSYNKLAKNIKPRIEEQLGKPVKHSAVVMALRRTAGKFQEPPKQPSFSYSIETIKTDISYLVFEESPTLLNQFEKLYSIIDFKKGGILNIIQGNYEVSIIINNKYKDEILDILSEEHLIDAVDDLVSISLTYSKNFLFTPGILYDISRFLAWESINAIDIILTKTEFSLIIGKKDLMRCYQTLGRFAEDPEKGEARVKSILE